MIWEMANWFLEFLDGSSPHEQACDSLSTTDGILQIAAAGNLTTSDKHFRQTVAGDLGRPHGDGAHDDAPVLHRDAAVARERHAGLHGEVGRPGGAAHGLQRPGLARARDDGLGHESSTRNTHKVDFYIVLSGGRPAGDFSFHVDVTGADIDLSGFLEDPDSGWSKGVAWTMTSVTDVGNYGTPAVSDHTLAVATMMNDWPYMTHSGDLAFWSGQGPRIDGADTIDS